MGKAITSVIEFARLNGGVFTRSEATALGMSPTTLQRRVAEGVFIQHRHGVLALPGAPDPHVLDLHVACRKLGAVVSHQSAAYLHELDSLRDIQATVSVPRNRTKDLAGVTVHQLDDIDETQITTIRGLSVTKAERTVLDLAVVVSERHLARVLDTGLATGRVDIEELDDLLRRVGRRGRPGTAVMRRLLEARLGEATAPESELERRLLEIISVSGLPSPVRQFHAPWLRSINGRVDLAYPDHLLVIEGDSRRWHTVATAFETDRLRDNAAQLAGWRILRFTWDEITKNPTRVISTIRTALELERI